MLGGGPRTSNKSACPWREQSNGRDGRKQPRPLLAATNKQTTAKQLRMSVGKGKMPPWLLGDEPRSRTCSGRALQPPAGIQQPEAAKIPAAMATPGKMRVPPGSFATPDQRSPGRWGKKSTSSQPRLLSSPSRFALWALIASIVLVACVAASPLREGGGWAVGTQHLHRSSLCSCSSTWDAPGLF